jgi:hypothetical protein
MVKINLIRGAEPYHIYGQLPNDRCSRCGGTLKTKFGVVAHVWGGESRSKVFILCWKCNGWFDGYEFKEEDRKSQGSLPWL